MCAPDTLLLTINKTTNEYIKGAKNGLCPSFYKHIWQRNYYEHIIRDEEVYLKMWDYIDSNPIIY